MTEKYLSDLDLELVKVVDHLKSELNSIRANRAHPSIVENIRADAYGSKMSLNQLATITAPETDLIVIQPWDPTVTDAIVKAINAGGLGVNAMKDSGLIRIKLPPLSADRRAELIKIVKVKGEDTLVALRNVRRKFIEDLDEIKPSEDEEHRLKKEIDEICKKFTDMIHDLVQAKEAELVKI